MDDRHAEDSPEDRTVRIGPDGLFASGSSVLDRALTLVEHLRERCEWDRAQTSRSLLPHLIEEAHEAAEAIEAGDAGALASELGDLLLNLAFQIVVAEEVGSFVREDVVSKLESKMVRRHPDIFDGGERQSWESIKAAERDGGAVDGLSASLPPLLRAHRLQERAAGVGFDWDAPDGALAKVREEVEEVEAALAAADARAVEEELGDLLFSVVNLARLAGTHAHLAMTAATRKFETRFRSLEALARARNVALPGASLQALDALWDEVKSAESE